jgi:hypothetical protein
VTIRKSKANPSKAVLPVKRQHKPGHPSPAGTLQEWCDHLVVLGAGPETPLFPANNRHGKIRGGIGADTRMEYTSVVRLTRTDRPRRRLLYRGSTRTRHRPLPAQRLCHPRDPSRDGSYGPCQHPPTQEHCEFGDLCRRGSPSEKHRLGGTDVRRRRWRDRGVRAGEEGEAQSVGASAAGELVW